MAELDRQHRPNREMIRFNEDNMKRQYTAFPYPHMCYVRENADAETQLKLRQTCKYFYKMNRKFIVEKLFFGRAPSSDAGKLDIYVQNFYEMPMIDVVINKIECYSSDKRMVSKIRHCEAKVIELIHCELSMDQFLFFTQSGMVQKLRSFLATIRDENGKLISLEALLLHLPNAEIVRAKVQDVTRNASPRIVSSNNNIKELVLDFHGPISTDQFYELLKKVLAPDARLFILFNGLTNKTYLPTFKAEMDAKMKTWAPQNETPTIYISEI